MVRAARSVEFTASRSYFQNGTAEKNDCFARDNKDPYWLLRTAYGAALRSAPAAAPSAALRARAVSMVQIVYKKVTFAM